MSRFRTSAARLATRMAIVTVLLALGTLVGSAMHVWTWPTPVEAEGPCEDLRCKNIYECDFERKGQLGYKCAPLGNFDCYSTDCSR